MSGNGVVRVGRAQVLRLPGNRATVTGTLAEVAPVLAALRRSGRLAAASDPVPNGAGTVLVNVRLTPAAQQRPVAVRRRLSRRLVAGIATMLAIAVVALLYGLWLAVAWLAAHIAVLAGIAVILVLVSVAAGPRACKTVITIVHRH